MPTIYSCPMHPDVKLEKEGLCPKCGMKLLMVKVKDQYKPNKSTFAKASADRHEGHSISSFAKKFWISLLLTVPVIFYSEILNTLFSFRAPVFSGYLYIPFVLGSVIFFYGGLVFLSGAKRELEARLPGMMTLIAMAITVAYIYSIYATFFGGNGLFWELSTLITIMLLGHYLEMKAVQQAQGALKELSKLIPDTAEIIKNGKTSRVPVAQLKIGDVVFIRPGGIIPIDGVVIEGSSDINESMVTGESKPVLKNKNDEVIGGTINGSGSIKFKVTKVGDKTFLSGVMKLIEEAQTSKSRLQILSDKAAFFLTIIALLSGGTTFFSWILIGKDVSFALERLVSVLIIACPHALGLAVPLVASISTSIAAKNGFLIRQRLALEQARNIDEVLFDKTGTLTEGKYGISRIWSMGVSESEVLKLAASVDINSEHFIAKAIVEEARKRKLVLGSVKNFRAMPGSGARGRVGNSEIIVGGNSILTSGSLKSKVARDINKENKEGKSIIYVLNDRKLVGAISLEDVIREESSQAISDLKGMKVKTAMITGDSKEVAEHVAKSLSIDEYFANVKPQEKSEKVKVLQRENKKVAMVGDGINDAPALTQADLGIAIGAGTNVAIESAGIVLVKNDPRDVVRIIKLSAITYSKMVQNLFWATGYNIIAIPLAAGILYSKGIILQPALAAVLMSASTVIVAANAVLLKKERI